MADDVGSFLGIDSHDENKKPDGAANAVTCSSEGKAARATGELMAILAALWLVSFLAGLLIVQFFYHLGHGANSSNFSPAIGPGYTVVKTLSYGPWDLVFGEWLQVIVTGVIILTGSFLVLRTTRKHGISSTTAILASLCCVPCGFGILSVLWTWVIYSPVLRDACVELFKFFAAGLLPSLIPMFLFLRSASTKPTDSDS
jgi:hypothetical protein